MYNEIERLEQKNGWHRLSKDIAMSWGRTKTFLTRNNLTGTLSGIFYMTLVRLPLVNEVNVIVVKLNH